MKILIADDDLTSRLVLAGVLKKHGHEVVASVDGAEAWSVLQRPDAPRLAILDWVMPGLAGVDVCRRVRTIESDQPPYIILLTSRDQKTDIVTGLEAGAIILTSWPIRVKWYSRLAMCLPTPPG